MKYRNYLPRAGWTIVVAPLRLGRIPLGHLVRLEDGPLFLGPASHLGISWWWRFGEDSAFALGYDKAQQNPRRCLS